MPSSRSAQTEGLQLFLFSIPYEVLLQLGTGSMLVALLGGKAFAEGIQAIGQASEEVFRGDRLPVIKFPVPAESESSQSLQPSK